MAVVGYNIWWQLWDKNLQKKLKKKDRKNKKRLKKIDKDKEFIQQDTTFGGSCGIQILKKTKNKRK